MKKIYYLFCIFILIGCSKKAEVSPTTNSIVITYSFKASVSGNYSLYYANPNSLSETQVQFTGNTSSKTDTISNVSSYPNGYGFPLSMGSALSVAGENCTLTISVNNKVKSTGSFSVANPGAFISYNYVILH
jgi:hypothetical protein